MKIEDMLFIVLLTFGVISLIFRCLIRKNVIKPSKISRIFYQDDESFINYWRETQEKGILKYTIKNIIYMTITFGMVVSISIFYKRERQTLTPILFEYLSICVISGLIGRVSWGDNQNKYNQLKEKENMENYNINNSDKKTKA